MANAADKARFYLEKAIPELQELEKKKIFTKDEITRIIKQRSDFEHKVNARGASFLDFLRYVEFELNLEDLRSKRVKRLGIKNTRGSGQKRVFFILDRATKKFPGEIGLQKLYLDVARKYKAFGKAAQIITGLLRLHPTKPEAWILAAHYAVDEHGDMTEARSHLQRGLRFCKKSKEMWLTYTRIELSYISKILARQQILGLASPKKQPDKPAEVDDPNADMIPLPGLGQTNSISFSSSDAGAERSAAQDLLKSPVLSGAIPRAIFDSATEASNDAEFVGRFFDLVCDFENLPCSPALAQHIMEYSRKVHPSDPVSLDCWIRQPLIGVSKSDTAFPKALALCYSKLKSSLDDNYSTTLAYRTIRWISSFLQQDVEETCETVLHGMMLRTLIKYKECTDKTLDANGDATAAMLELIAENSKDILASGLPWALQNWPTNNRLLALQDADREEALAIIP